MESHSLPPKKAHSLEPGGPNQQEGAALLHKFALLMRDDVVMNRPSFETWKKTMQMFAAGQLSQHADLFADTAINELLGCLDSSKGKLNDAWAATE